MRGREMVSCVFGANAAEQIAMLDEYNAAAVAVVAPSKAEFHGVLAGWVGFHGEFMPDDIFQAWLEIRKDPRACDFTRVYFPAKTSDVIGALREMDGAARMEFIEQLKDEFCIHCGSDSGMACYCTRDD